ncbi:MAG: flagellar basal body P-ring formation chaperone FlgA, partial [Comamonas sp.]
LAPCARIEPYLPSGSKLWGRTRIGLRCVEGPKPWNVFLPVTIKAFGPAWVLTNNVSMGEVLTHDHAMQTEVDWAESPHAIIALPDDWVGQTAARHLTAGMALRQTMVKAAQIFQPGAGVKVLVQGGGFVVTSSGKALEGGAIGQNVRVRMDNGRTVIGTVSPQGEVVVAQ